MAESAVHQLVFEEQGGQKRRLVLRGPALPFAGTMRFGVESDLRTEHYGTHSSQQLSGHRLAPVRASGLWEYTQLSAGTFAEFDGDPIADEETLLEAVLSLRDAGEVLRLQFGPHVRYGRFRRVEPSPGRWGEIFWSWDFEPFSRDDYRGPHKPAVTPQDAGNAFTRAIDSALDGVDWFEEQVSGGATTFQDAMDRYVRGPLSVWTAGGRALQQASNAVSSAVSDIFDAGTQFTDGLLTYSQAVTRLGSLGGEIVQQTDGMRASIDTLTPPEVAGTSDPSGQISAAVEIGSTRSVAYALRVEAAEMAARSKRQSGGESNYRVHVVRQGEDMRDIAFRYYDDPDVWLDLAYFNGFTSSEVAVGQEIIVPKTLDGVAA